MNKEIFILKQIGHDLLEQYVSLGRSDNKKKETRLAYEELGRRLKKNQNTHFSMMTTEEEVEAANARLFQMLEERKTRKGSKAQFAPNLAELQKQASQLNPHLS